MKVAMLPARPSCSSVDVKKMCKSCFRDLFNTSSTIARHPSHSFLSLVGEGVISSLDQTWGQAVVITWRHRRHTSPYANVASDLLPTRTLKSCSSVAAMKNLVSISTGTLLIGGTYTPARVAELVAVDRTYEYQQRSI